MPATVEETGLSLAGLAAWADHDPRVAPALERGVAWLARHTDRGQTTPAAPIGLYFARLWYYEELYPLLFATAGLRAATAAGDGARV